MSSPLPLKVKTFRALEKLSTAKLAQLVGTSRQNIENLEAGEVEQPRYLSSLAKVMGRTVEELLDPAAPLHDKAPLGPEHQPVGAKGEVGAPRPVRVVPILYQVPEDDWDDPTAIPLELLMDLRYTDLDLGKSGFGIHVKGDSMRNPFGTFSVPEGALIYVNSDRQAQPGNFVVVKHKGSKEFDFKRLSEDGGHYYLQPLNPQFPVKPLPDDSEICGVVVHVQLPVPET